MHILPNIPRSKGNQTNKFVQLIKYNVRIIFLENSYTKCGGETTPKPFSKKSKLSISLDQQFDFIVCPCRGLTNYLKNKVQSTFTSHKAFLRNAVKSGTSLLVSFSAWLLKKNISLTEFYCLVGFTSWDIGNQVVAANSSEWTSFFYFVREVHFMC